MLAAGRGRRACLSFQSSLTLIKKYDGTAAFTVKYGGRVNLLMTDAGVSEAFDPARSAPGSKQPPFHAVKAIWDTGASRTCITEDVVAKLGLSPIDETTNHTAAGPRKVGVYLVNVRLPNRVVFPVLRVTDGIISGADMLIGMDVIGSGDFAVTGSEGATWMTFSLPSVRRLDFVDESNNA